MFDILGIDTWDRNNKNALTIIFIQPDTFVVYVQNVLGNWKFYTHVPHIVFRFSIFLLIEGQDVICIKSCLPATSSPGKQCETHRNLYVCLGGGSLVPGRGQHREAGHPEVQGHQPRQIPRHVLNQPLWLMRFSSKPDR